MSNLHGSVDASHGSVKSYLTGFVLSVILTVIPFALVMYPTLPKPVTAGVVAIFAVIQLVVHLIYFLHLNFTPHQRWNVTALVFSTVVIALLVGLSLWIMYSVHHNMLAH
ncbi:cytochrome o ubiquinol oxidase subunit IV [Pseudomonas alvandae]|uniref:cytochrome o ubiquinol oxidase subunit IV n=1 Tax=Pseudomonas canavaninivorans TaxID=2842348 RepID=UPI002B1D74AA|nr:cytochrome o ubiquinol oxidase subunit IV [Pseudomonas canavaninivorans]